jgi:STE24 endopeptidase
MSSLAFSVLFVVFLAISLSVRFWLGSRQIRHVLHHRSAVPAEFAEKIPLAAHQKAADYTIAKTKFGLFGLLVNATVLIGFTLLGGLQWLSGALFGWAGPGMTYQIGLLVAFALISGVIDLPLEYYKQFVLEARYGFNKMTPKLFFTDLLKNTLLGAAIGLPLIWVVLMLMEKSGNLWWLYAWLVWSGFQLLMLVLYPSVIAPMFNKFTPLTDASLRARIEGLMQRVGFASKGLFVMDGSKRSAHGNAYFSGFGAGKRIVFFDTLLARLAPHEIEAVLAHELGHFKLRHIVKRIVVIFAVSLVFLALLGYLKQQLWFYTGLGVNPLLLADLSNNDAMALILFMLALPIFTFLLSPLSSISSRKHEFEADAFAARHTDANDLVAALVKLYEDNASTLTPDPLHSAFYDSHPPASVRIKKLTDKLSDTLSNKLGDKPMATHG